jgi:hypothetical protein
MKAGAKPAPLIHAEVSGTRLMPLIKATGAPPEAMKFLEKFAKMERIPVLSVKIEGGDRLVMHEEIGIAPLVALFATAGRVANSTFEKVERKVVPPKPEIKR